MTATAVASRKIVQLVKNGEASWVALADDGTIWKTASFTAKWTEVPVAPILPIDSAGGFEGGGSPTREAKFFADRPRPEDLRQHDLKCWPHWFDAIWDGTKTFEIRENDRQFHVGDQILLREWDIKGRDYTGRQSLRVISYMMYLSEVPGLDSSLGNWVALGLRRP